MPPFGPNALLNVCNRLQTFRLNHPALWNFTANYAKSAEEKLGIDKPKKPSSSFLKFVEQVRPTILSKNPGISPTDVVKLASQHWQKIGDDVKEKLNKEYERELQKYKKSMEVYDKNLSSEQKEDIRRLENEMVAAKERRKMKAEIKELGKPKRPMSSYLLFLQSQKESIKDSSLGEYHIKMKEKWYKLTADEKSFWEQKAESLKNNYRKQLTEWEEKMIQMGNYDFVRNKVLAAKKPKQPTA